MPNVGQKVNNNRDGKVYLIKLIMKTKNGKINDYAFMKVESFVNFESDDFESIQQLRKQIRHKIRFYEELYSIRIFHHSWHILYSQRIMFLPKPYFKNYKEKRGVYE